MTIIESKTILNLMNVSSLTAFKKITHIETFVLCDLIIENLNESNFNDFFSKMNTKTKHNKIDLFKRENK